MDKNPIFLYISGPTDNHKSELGKDEQADEQLELELRQNPNIAPSPAVLHLLASLFRLEKLMYKLPDQLQENIKKLTILEIDNTNEVRAETKSNSDRLTEVQKNLSDNITGLKDSVKELKERQKEMVNTMKQNLNDALSMLNLVMTTMSRMERGTKPVDLPINPAPAINNEHSNNP